MALNETLIAIKKNIGMYPANKFFYNIYFDSFLILVLFYVLSKLVVLISKKIILKLAKKTKTEIDDIIIRKTNKPISLILLFIGIRLALLPLGIRQNIHSGINHIISSIVIVIVIYVIIVVLDAFIDNWAKKVAEKTKSTSHDEIIPIFHRFSRVFISAIGVLFILPVWGIQIGPLLTSLGIAGIAVAFALQNTLGNIFGGMSIILDKSIRVGDKIALDNNTVGTVVDVGLRSTKIVTLDNELVTIPNGKLADSNILNFMQPDPRVRIAIDLGVEYGADISKVKEIVLNTIKKMPNVLKEPTPKVTMAEMGEFALKFRALFWVKEFDEKADAKGLAVEEIYKALRTAGIGIPYPTRTVYIKDKK